MVFNPMATATLIYHDKAVFADAAIVEMRIWRLPFTDTERPHGLKYSLFYGESGRRIVGYDNEKGKSDHRHVNDLEERYDFIDIETLVNDFLKDVHSYRSKK